MENTIKFFWNGIKVNGKLNKFRFGFDSINYFKFLCDEFVHEQKKDEVKRENGILCGILTKVNKQTQRRITL